MAHKKGEGSSQNGRESRSKRLGVKISGGALAIAGNIIVRQRGTKFHPGNGVGIGKDHTIYAVTDGIVEFRRRKNDRCFINILPQPGEQVEVKKAKPKKKTPVEVPAEPVTETKETKAHAETPAVEAPAEVEKKAPAKEAAKTEKAEKEEKSKKEATQEKPNKQVKMKKDEPQEDEEKPRKRKKVDPEKED